MCDRNEAGAVSRDLSLLDSCVSKSVMPIIYMTLAIVFGHELLGFPSFTLSTTHLLLITTGVFAAMGIGIGWLAIRQMRRTRRSGDESRKRPED